MADETPVKSLKQQRAETKARKEKRSNQKVAAVARPVFIEQLKQSNVPQNLINDALAEIDANQASTEPSPPVWDTVENLRLTCWETYRTPSGIVSMLRDPVVLNSQHATAIAKLATQLNKDLTLLESELQTLLAMHKGRTGAAVDAEEHFKALEIGGSYTTWLNNYTSLIIPLMGDITELVAKASEEARPDSADDLIESISG